MNKHLFRLQGVCGMCWSEVSVGTSVFSSAAALFLIVRGDWTRKFYGGCILGVCAMQWAEQQVKVCGLPRLLRARLTTLPGSPLGAQQVSPCSNPHL